MRRTWEKMVKKYRDEEAYILGVVSACEALYLGDIIFGLIAVCSEGSPTRKFEGLWKACMNILMKIW